MRTSFLLGVGAMIVTACGGQPAARPTGDAAPLGLRLEVVNLSSSDAEIFLVSGSQRVRVGMAPANLSRVFDIPPAQVPVAGLIRVQAVPIGLGRATTSEPLTINNGETIKFEIPPL